MIPLEVLGTLFAAAVSFGAAALIQTPQDLQRREFVTEYEANSRRL